MGTWNYARQNSRRRVMFGPCPGGPITAAAGLPLCRADCHPAALAVLPPLPGILFHGHLHGVRRNCCCGTIGQPLQIEVQLVQPEAVADAPEAPEPER